MSSSCKNCEKNKHRSLCTDCGHSCCKGSKHSSDYEKPQKRDHKKKESHKKSKKCKKDYYSDSSSSSDSSDSYDHGAGHGYGGGYSHGGCGKGGDCDQKDCGDKCRVFKRVEKKRKLKVAKVKLCKSRRSKKPLDQSFTVNDITVTNPEGKPVDFVKEQLKLCGSKSTIGAIRDDGRDVQLQCPVDCNQQSQGTFTKTQYRNYSVTMCGSKAKCADVTLGISTDSQCGFQVNGGPSQFQICGDVKYKLVVTTAERDCYKQEVDKYCEKAQRVFVESACKPDATNAYRLTWKNVPLGKDLTVFTFCRHPLDCKDEYFGDKEYPTYALITDVCVYANPKY